MIKDEITVQLASVGLAQARPIVFGLRALFSALLYMLA